MGVEGLTFIPSACLRNGNLSLGAVDLPISSSTVLGGRGDVLLRNCFPFLCFLEGDFLVSNFQVDINVFLDGERFLFLW